MLVSIGSMGALASPSTVRAAAWALTTYRSPALMGATELDKICPRSAIHLRGGMTAPKSDGYPMATTRHGFARTRLTGPIPTEG